MSDGGWSKLDIDTAVTQIDVILQLITTLDAECTSGRMPRPVDGVFVMDEDDSED